MAECTICPFVQTCGTVQEIIDLIEKMSSGNPEVSLSILKISKSLYFARYGNDGREKLDGMLKYVEKHFRDKVMTKNISKN